MEMHERIRYLRKDYLKMSQLLFGERLGVSRSVIKNIELNALARPEQKLSLIKLMCKEFNINEEWLLNGTEPMIVKSDTFSLDSFVKQHGMTDFELEILKTYFELDPAIRTIVLDHFKKSFMKINNILTSEPENETIEELEESYKKSYLNSVQNISSSAMNITQDTEKNISNK